VKTAAHLFTLKTATKGVTGAVIILLVLNGSETVTVWYTFTDRRAFQGHQKGLEGTGATG